MNRAVIWSALAVAGTVGLARWLGQGPRVVPGQSRVLLLGDSMAEALIPPMKQLAKDDRIAFHGVAVRGSTVQQWARRADLEQIVNAAKPDLILVALGTNDAHLTPASLASEAPALQALLKRLRKTGAYVAWVGPPKIMRGDNGAVDWIRSAVPSADYYDSRSLLIGRGPDRLHPTVRGAAGWAAAIWRWLR